MHPSDAPVKLNEGWCMKKAMVGFLLAVAGILTAQNNHVVDGFLAREVADFDTAAYLLFVGSGQLPETATPAEARAKALEAGWGITETIAAKPLDAGTWAHMLLKGLGINGGLMYSLFGGGWYGYKEASYRSWYPAGFSAGRVLKPYEAIQALNSAMELQASRKEAASE